MLLAIKVITLLMLESNLVKILEYGKISMKDFLSKVAESLNLEFYSEEGSALYTLSSQFFVLDIIEDDTGGKATLIFVDESLNVKLSYIQEYLSFFLKKKHIFYHLLKYLVNCTSKTHIENGDGDLNQYKCICSCIFTGKYCKIFNMDEDINIFTHKKQDIPLEYYFYDPKKSVNPIDSAFISRITDIFTPENFNLKCVGLDCGNQIHYKYGNIKVDGRSVFINNERSKIASFAFLKGCPLVRCIEMDKKLTK